MSKSLVAQTLAENMPDSLLRSAVAAHAANAIDPELRAVSEASERPLVYAAIDRLNSLQLDHLAVQFDLAPWRDTWPVELKRRIVRQMVPQKARVGTVSAVKTALASLGLAAAVREWWQKTPAGEPHTFEVTATLPEIEGQLDAQTQEDLFALIDEAKPVRSHYTFVLATALAQTLRVANAFCMATYARLTGEHEAWRTECRIGSAAGHASFARITSDSRVYALRASPLALSVHNAVIARLST